jgi:hypothetical protein
MLSRNHLQALDQAEWLETSWRLVALMHGSRTPLLLNAPPSIIRASLGSLRAVYILSYINDCCQNALDVSPAIVIASMQF